MDIDQEVIKEIDVFVSKRLSKYLYHLIYKHRPKSRPMERENILEVRLKPGIGMMEMDVAMDSNSANYNKEKAKNIADNNPTLFTNGQMDKYTLRAMPSGESPDGREAIAYIMEDGLHLVPMDNPCMIMDPSHDHLSKPKLKEMVKGKPDDKDLLSVQPIQMKFDRAMTLSRQLREDTSYKGFMSKIGEEAWQRCHYLPYDEDTVYARRMPLMCSQDDMYEASVLPVLSKENYLKVFAPPMEKKRNVKTAPGETGLLSQLRNIPLPEQVKRLMINAKVIRFNKLVDYLRDVSMEPESVTAPLVLKHLNQVAVLVRGCWVVKSEVLYPPNTLSAHSAVSSELLCKARDYILWHFHANRPLTRKEISSVIKIPSMEVLELLEQVSRRRLIQGKEKANRWEFILDFDADFVRKYSDMVHQQEQHWEVLIQHLCSILKIDKPKPIKDSERYGARRPRSRYFSETSDSDGDVSSGGSSCGSGGPSSTKKGRKRSHSTSSYSGGKASVCASSHSLGKSGSHSAITSPTANPATITLSQRSNSVNTSSVCPTDGEGLTLSQSLMPPPETAFLPTNSREDLSDSLIEEMETFLHEKLQSRPVVSLSTLCRLFRLSYPQRSAGRMSLESRLDQLLVNKLKARKIMCKWPEQSRLEIEPLYSAGASSNDSNDKVRELLFSALEQQQGITITMFRKMVEECEITPQPDEKFLRKLLKRFCVYRYCRYFLKYTIDDSDGSTT